MGKLKLNLVSGLAIEKPLINAFKANNTIYVILDNEMNGSMGLPIILVCKYDNNKLVQITDDSEWQMVKEYLKKIIAGEKLEYVNVPNELPADEVYYRQLTLPVPSFDALKNAYKVETTSTEEVGIFDINANVPPQAPTPTETVAPKPPVPPVVENVTPTVNVETPVVETANVQATPNVSIPQVDGIINNAGGEAPIPEAAPIANPVETPTSVMPDPQTVINNPSEDIFKEQKEAFMQACENMFDALVQKFEKELDNRK